MIHLTEASARWIGGRWARDGTDAKGLAETRPRDDIGDILTAGIVECGRSLSQQEAESGQGTFRVLS